MNVAALGSGLVALWQATADWFASPALTGSPEPLWMVLWGAALLGFAAGARRKRSADGRNAAKEPA